MNQSITDLNKNNDEILLANTKGLLNSCDLETLKTSFYEMYIAWTVSDNADCSYDRAEKSKAISSFLQFLNQL